LKFISIPSFGRMVQYGLACLWASGLEEIPGSIPGSAEGQELVVPRQTPLRFLKMDAAARRKIYEAQVENVHSLEAARRQINRAINRALRANDDAMAEVQTKLLGLLFCAWAEANFLKMLHMHSHLTLAEIQQIKRRWGDLGIIEGWYKCIE